MMTPHTSSAQPDTPSTPEAASLDQNTEELAEDAKEADQAPKPDPTRFGDWEKNGRCIDF